MQDRTPTSVQGRTDAVTDITVNIDIVQSNVRALNAMFDQLDTGVRGVNAAQGLQTTTTWTDTPACAQFAATYGAALGVLGERLTATWGMIRQQAETLRDAAAALAATDEQTQAELASTQASLDALISRADRGPGWIAPTGAGPMRAV